MAHNAGGSLQQGIDANKLAAVWEYASSPLFSDAERAALEALEDLEREPALHRVGLDEDEGP